MQCNSEIIFSSIENRYKLWRLARKNKSFRELFFRVSDLCICQVSGIFHKYSTDAFLRRFSLVCSEEAQCSFVMQPYGMRQT